MATKIDWMELPGRGGRVGMMACPGAPGYRGAADGAIAMDLDQLHVAGARVLVTLLTGGEMQMIGVARLGRVAEECGIWWVHLPVEDMRAPGEGFEHRWAESGPLLHEELTAGRHVVLHCYAGLGRTGTVAARLLVECGIAPAQAIEDVRKVRRGAIQTPEQERYVLALAGESAPPRR